MSDQTDSSHPEQPAPALDRTDLPSKRRSRPAPAPAARQWLRDHTVPLLWAIALVSGLAAALAPAEPVGARAGDLLWCSMIGAAVPLIASRARRWALIWTGGIAAVVGIGGDPAGRAGALALVVLIVVAALSDHRDRLVAALIGGFAVQALLHGPSYGPVWLPTLVGVVALAPVVWSARKMARRRERKVVTRLVLALGALVALASMGAVVASLDARSTLQAGADDAIDGLDLIRAGDSPGATERFATGAQAFESASGSLQGPLSWGGRYIPVVGQHIEALRAVATSGESLATSAAVTASTADYRKLTADEGSVDLDRVRALQGPVASSAATVTAALTAVAEVRSPWLITPVSDQLDRFETELTDAGEQATLAAEGLAVAPGLLGGDGTKRYFVAFASPGESRNGGGFVGVYGVLTATGGNLDLVDPGNIYRLFPGVTNPYAFDPPPDWEERYGSYFVQIFLGNLALSPDWPTNTGVAGQLFPQTPGGSPIDGAVYADPTALAGMLELTGPIAVPGLDITLDANNVVAFLERDQYVLFDPDDPNRKELLGDVAEATFKALTSRSLPGISTLADTLGPLVADGHLRVSVFDDRSEAYLDRLGLSGRWSVPAGSDYVSVRSTNLDANKIDSFLHRDIDLATVVDPATGELRSTLTVHLRNDAPGSGLPRYIIGNGTGRPAGTNRNLLTVYTPHELTSAALDGERIGTSREREFGGAVYSVVVEIPPGATRTVVLDLDGTVSQWPYSLAVLPQATANPDRMSVSLTGSPDLGPAPQFTGSLGPKLLLGG